MCSRYPAKESTKFHYQINSATVDIPIFFLENIPSGNVITLTEEVSKHVVQVLRMKPDETLKLSDGKGNLVTAKIIDDHKKKCTVQLVDKTFVDRKPQQVCIAISLLKNASRFEWFLEKATEIGATEIMPLLSDRTEKQHFRHERMQQIMVSAMMQSKQVWLPQLHQPMSFSQAIEATSCTEKLIAHCEEEPKLAINDFRHAPSVQVLIGPEGDFTKEEIDAAISSGYKPVTLGTNRLRAETAGMVAATILCV